MSLAGDDALSLDEIIAAATRPSFSPMQIVCESLGSSKSAAEMLQASDSLVARFDTYAQDVAAALAVALADLQRVEKRIQYQVDLLKSDVGALSAKQAEIAETVVAKVNPETEAPILSELARLDLVKCRILEVESLLKEASEFRADAAMSELDQCLKAGNTEAAEQIVLKSELIANVFVGTAEESARLKTVESLRQRLRSVRPPSESSYYDLIGKLRLS